MRKLLFISLMGISSFGYANCGNGNGNGNGCGGGGTTVNNTYVTNQAVTNLYQSGTITNNTNNVFTSQGPISRLVGELDLNLWDGEMFSFNVFDGYAFNDTPGQDVFMDGRNNAYGFRLTWKLGPSHVEDEIKELRKEIKQLKGVTK